MATSGQKIAQTWTEKLGGNQYITALTIVSEKHRKFWNPFRHSQSFFGMENLPDSVLNEFMAVFKHLKVLDLQDAAMEFLPEEVGGLFYLRYL